MTRIALYAIGGLAILAALWWVQSRIRVSYQAEQQRDQAIAAHQVYRTAVEKQARLAAEQQARDMAADQALTARITALQADNEALRRAASRIPATVEKANDKGVVCPAINPDWWLCQSAALSGDTADAKACSSSSGDGSVRN